MHMVFEKKERHRLRLCNCSGPRSVSRCWVFWSSQTDGGSQTHHTSFSGFYNKMGEPEPEGSLRSNFLTPQYWFCSNKTPTWCSADVAIAVCSHLKSIWLRINTANETVTALCRWAGVTFLTDETEDRGKVEPFWLQINKAWVWSVCTVLFTQPTWEQ